MELKEFIKSSLLAIAEGVEEASDSRTQGKKKFHIHNQLGIMKDAEYIDFDIAVIASSEASVKGGAKAKIMVAGAGVEGEMKEGTEHISRIKFKVYHG